MRTTIALTAVLALSACNSPEAERLRCKPPTSALQCLHERQLFMAKDKLHDDLGQPNIPDVMCVRQEMQHGGTNHGTLPFDYALSACQQMNSGALGLIDVREIPFDFRDDPELQRMIEDPKQNVENRAYIRRDGTSTNGWYQ